MEAGRRGGPAPCPTPGEDSPSRNPCRPGKRACLHQSAPGAGPTAPSGRPGPTRGPDPFARPVPRTPPHGTRALTRFRVRALVVCGNLSGHPSAWLQALGRLPWFAPDLRRSRRLRARLLICAPPSQLRTSPFFHTTAGSPGGRNVHLSRCGLSGRHAPREGGGRRRDPPAGAGRGHRIRRSAPGRRATGTSRGAAPARRSGRGRPGPGGPGRRPGPSATARGTPAG